MYNWIADIVPLIGEDGGAVTLPHNIENAVSEYSDYKASLSVYNYPQTAVENNLPGISLRTFGGYNG